MGASGTCLSTGVASRFWLVVTGANRHDVTQLQAVLDGCEVEDKGKGASPRHLCADAAYTGEPARQSIEERGYIPHVKGRGQEASELKREPGKRARRWIVEVAHSWFNRFRKLLVRYEKLHCTYVALNHLAAAIIAFRKVPLKVNIIYG